MTEEQMIQDLVAQLDGGFSQGVGHVNVSTDGGSEGKKEVETMGCTDCSRTPLACSVPTLHQGIDDFQ
ncbi:MAG: hypothetical protein IKI75_12985 [Lachnospiraceae bacterium]|nr:hypothetical protein [Lachnospiraceae bacterium]